MKVPEKIKFVLTVRTIEFTLIILGFFVFWFYSKFEISGDGEIRFKAILKLIENQEISDIKYSIIGSIFSLPLYFLGWLYKSPEYFLMRYNLILFIVAIIIAYKILIDHLDGGIVRKFVLLVMTASMFPHHIRHYYGEVFTSLSVFVGVLGVTLSNTGLGWLPLILGTANTPASILGLALIVIKRACKSHRWRYLLYLSLTLLIIVLESWIRRGSIFASGYENDRGFETILPFSGKPGFSYPFFLGLISIFFSFGKGIIFYAPGLLLSLKPYLSVINPKVVTSHRLILWYLAGLVIVYSSWWSWYGGFFWGPRFFLVASIAASFSLAFYCHYRSKKIIANLITLMMLVWSTWVGINGAIFGQSGLDICFKNNYELEFLCWYVPEFSPLVHPFINNKTLADNELIIIGYIVLVLIYLATPILYLILKKLFNTIKVIKGEYLDFEKWRF